MAKEVSRVFSYCMNKQMKKNKQFLYRLCISIIKWMLGHQVFKHSQSQVPDILVFLQGKANLPQQDSNQEMFTAKLISQCVLWNVLE